jgi:L-aspartate oxidase
MRGGGVLLLTKDTIEQSNTWYAQGGIAAVLQPLDSVESHVQDTLTVGVGLCDEKAVRIVVEEGPKRVLELLQWGANFDKKAGNRLRPRLWRGGRAQLRADPACVRRCDGKGAGADAYPPRARTRFDARVGEQLRDRPHHGRWPLRRRAGADRRQRHGDLGERTILASGGAGQLYRESTNPKIATADGHAMAYRAGAELQDMEMVQFHPTTLYVAGSSRALITEAVRGEGAHLVDRNGYRFMFDYHKDGELAPRDVVSRAIVEQIRKTHFTHVFLDARHLPAEEFRERFPQLGRLCRSVRDRSGERFDPHPSCHALHDRRGQR